MVVKRATGGGRAGLRREAEVLAAVGGPELVQLVELHDADEITELVLRDVGGRSLAAVLADPATSAAAALELLAAGCESVARLHARGWGHGRLDTHHMLVTPRRRIRLCSLRSATPIDVDPATAAADRTAMLRAVDDWTYTTTERTRRRPTVARIRARLLARRTHRLQDDPDPLVLARILRRTARAGDLPVRRTLRTLATVALGVVALILAGRAVAGLVDAAVGGPSAVSSERAGATSTTAAPTTTIGGDVAGPGPDGDADSGDTDSGDADPAARCPAGASGRPDVDGDGCGDEVGVDGHVVVVDDRRYRVGATDDVVAVGDWDCDGTATAAVLRPSTGAVHVFSTWATDGADTSAAEIGAVDGAAGFAPRPDCGPPQVVTGSGQVVTVGGAVP